MGFDLDVSVPALTVFLQGIISFFSPCVLPLLPIYIGYLSGGTRRKGEDGRNYYDQKKVLIHTLCFVIGVSFAFFMLGLGVSALGSFFKNNQVLLSRVGGLFIVLLGLYQLGVFGKSGLLSKERRLPVSLNLFAMSPMTAFALGFTFSFAWTPCVGPALTSVLVMAASAQTQAKGFFLIGIYTLGFVLPFLAVGVFTTSVLEFFKKHRKVVAYTGKAGAILMIFMGLMMITGTMNDITGYLSKFSAPFVQEQVIESEAAGDVLVEREENNTEAEHTEVKDTEVNDIEVKDSETESIIIEESAAEETGTESKEAAENVFPAIDFTLYDQYGNAHTLSEYKGKTVFLNFWGTWCPPCRNELPEIQKLYEEYSAEEDPSVIILGIAAPGYSGEGSVEHITEFLEKNGYTYPVVMDTTAEMFQQYGIYSFPTTFMIDVNGNIFGYISGQLNEMMMRSIIEQTVTGVRYSTDTQS